jgi:hypothetical protein
MVIKLTSPHIAIRASVFITPGIAGLPVGYGINGSIEHVINVEFPNGSWLNMHPRNSNDVTGHSWTITKGKYYRLNRLRTLKKLSWCVNVLSTFPDRFESSI